MDTTNKLADFLDWFIQSQSGTPFTSPRLQQARVLRRELRLLATPSADQATQPAEAVAWVNLAPGWDDAARRVFTDSKAADEYHRHCYDLTPVYTHPAPASASEPATLPCGHPASLMLKSAETGEPLYCECCDAQSRARDAENREAELLAEVAELRASASVAGAGEALAELVALKDIKDRFEGTDYSAADPESFDAARADYARRKPLAWAAARAALAARPVADGEAGPDVKYLHHRLERCLQDLPDAQYLSLHCDFLRDVLAALARQAPAPLSQAVREGFWLAPMEPTIEMGWAYLEAAREASPLIEHAFNHPGYRAMRDSWLSRHPQPQAVTEDARDGERLDWIRDTFFDHKWNAVIGPGYRTDWKIVPHHRHIHLQDASGNAAGDFRGAIDAARAATSGSDHVQDQ